MSLTNDFGKERVLGGLAAISTTLDPEGRIHHVSPFHSLSYGLRHADIDGAAVELNATLQGAGFEALFRDNIMQDMWEKWVFIASLGAGHQFHASDRRRHHRGGPWRRADSSSGGMQ